MGREGKHTGVLDLVRLLAEIERNGQITQPRLAAALGLSSPTVTRLLQRARAEYGMQISRAAGREAYYKIEDWGLFDRERVYAYLKNALTTRTK